MIALLLCILTAAASCWEPEPVIDRNCNGVPQGTEALVDAEMPGCAKVLEGGASVWVSRDAWYAYPRYGCTLATAHLDADNDGLTGGLVQVPHDDGTYHLKILACDNCEGDHNPDQYDEDCDAVGDGCDNCLDIPNDQHDADLDEVGDVCDNCVFDENRPQTDTDGDGVGDACDLCPETYDPRQYDDDLDGVGNDCDPCPWDPEDDCVVESEEEQDEPDGAFTGPSGTGGCDTPRGGSWLAALILVMARRRWRPRRTVDRAPVESGGDLR